MTDSRDEHERYGYTPSVSEGELLGWLRSEADAAARIPSPWVMLIAAADTIERLRSERNEMQSELRKAETESSMLRVECGVLEKNAEMTYENHKRIVAELTEERDEARRSCCQLAAMVDSADTVLMYVDSNRFHEIAMRYMKSRGWDCFKDNA